MRAYVLSLFGAVVLTVVGQAAPPHRPPSHTPPSSRLAITPTPSSRPSLFPTPSTRPSLAPVSTTRPAPVSDPVRLRRVLPEDRSTASSTRPAPAPGRSFRPSLPPAPPARTPVTRPSTVPPPAGSWARPDYTRIYVPLGEALEYVPPYALDYDPYFRWVTYSSVYNPPVIVPVEVPEVPVVVPR